jgi:outer membrane protein TolC
LSLQWSIFDSGLTPGRVQEAGANLLGARARLRQTEQTVASEVTQAYLNVQTAAQKVVQAKAEVDNAENSLNLAMGRYRSGVAAYIEVTDAETALLTARTNQVNSLYGLSIARAALQRALGIEGGV